MKIITQLKKYHDAQVQSFLGLRRPVWGLISIVAWGFAIAAFYALPVEVGPAIAFLLIIAGTAAGITVMPWRLQTEEKEA